MNSTSHTATPRRHLKSATLHFVPALEIVAEFEPAGEKTRHVKQYNLDLESDEFVADGYDSVAVVLYVHRVGAPQGKVFPNSRIRDIKLAGTGAADYKFVEDEGFARAADANQGRRRLFVLARDARLLLRTAARAGATLALDVEAEVASQHPGTRSAVKPPQVLKQQFPLKPCCAHLALWVVPGQIRGTSTIGVGSFLLRDNNQWTELPLPPGALETKATGPQLDLRCQRVEAFVSTGGHPYTHAITLPPWLSAWRMSYSGLTWENLAPIAVLCRPVGGSEAVAFHIDVRQNIAEMIGDLDANSGRLELSNPEWQQDCATSRFGMLLARRELRGPIYNLRESIRRAWYQANNLPLPADIDKYVCGSLSLRICSHVLARRNGTQDPRSALHMNGIEVCQYILEGWHDWFGFHLSSSGPGEDPLFIDPWWTQEWNLAEMKADYGFKKQAALIVAVGTLLVCEAIVILWFLSWAVETAITRAFSAAGQALPTLISLPRLMEVKAFLDRSIAARAATAAAVATSWSLLKPCNNRVQMFDDKFNYSFFHELDAFESFARDLRQGPPAPVAVEPWPE